MKKTGRFKRLHKVIVGLLAGCLLVVFIAVRRKPPPPPPVSAVCNPVPISPPPLPSIVESITYQGPEIYGPVHSLHVEGDMVYMGLGDSFAVMDASNAAKPQLIGSIEWLQAYIESGFIINSIRDDIAYLYLNLPFSGIASLTIDLSNPTTPVTVSCDPSILYPEENLFANRYDIYSLGGGITIFEQSEDGSEIQEISTFTLYNPARIEWRQPAGQMVPLPHRVASEPMWVADFTFDERYLYVLNEEPRSGTYNCCGSLSILDLENPANPENINTFALPVETKPESIIAMGDYLFITLFHSPTTKITIIYDMSDKTDLIELVSVVSSQPPQVHDGYAYFPNWEDGEVDIWDIRAADGPEVVGKIFVPETERDFYRPLANNLAFVGNYIYLVNGGNLEILDNSDPANPTFIDPVQFPLLVSPTQIAVSENWLAGQFSNQEMQTLVIDQTGQMGNWQPLLTTDNADFVYDFALVDDYLYTTFFWDTLTSTVGLTTTLNVYDVRNNLENSPAALLSIPDFRGRHMAATSTHLFLLNPDRNPSVRIVDISSPTNPTVVGEILLESAGYYTSLAIWEDTLYLASETPSQGLWQFDVSNPAQPELVDFFPFESLYSMTVGNGYLFGLHDNQITVIDMSSSEGPVILESFILYTGTLNDLAYQDGVLYVAVGGRGVAAIRPNPENLK